MQKLAAECAACGMDEEECDCEECSKQSEQVAVLDDAPSIDDYDPLTKDYENALNKYWKQKGYSEIKEHSYFPTSTPYTMKGPDGKYYEAVVDEDTNKWTIVSLGGPQHDYADTPDKLPDPYNRSIPGLVRAKDAGSAAWTRSEGKNPEGGLNAKGRASYNKSTGGNLKPPVSAEAADKSPAKAKRRSSFCSRMCGMKAKRTGSEASRDPDSRINKALRKWDCSC